MSGEEITGNQHAEDNYFSDEEGLDMLGPRPELAGSRTQPRC
ncbi:hypothetical protein [Streptomyces shenzhenensis]